MGIIHHTGQNLFFRHGHHEMAFAVAHIKQFIDVPFFFLEDILSDDADVSCTIFDIDRKVHGLDNDEADFCFFIGYDKFP